VHTIITQNKLDFSVFFGIELCVTGTGHVCSMNETKVHGNFSCDCSWDEMFEVCADCSGMAICTFVFEHAYE